MIHLKEHELWDYIDKSLPFEKKDRVNTHLKLCSKCQQVYQSHLEIHQALKEVEHDIPSTGFSSQVMLKINKEIALENSIQFWLRFTKFAIIGSFGFTVLLMLFILGKQNINLPLIEPEKVRYLFFLLTAGILSWAFYGLDVLLIHLNKKQVN